MNIYWIHSYKFGRWLLNEGITSTVILAHPEILMDSHYTNVHEWFWIFHPLVIPVWIFIKLLTYVFQCCSSGLLKTFIEWFWNFHPLVKPVWILRQYSKHNLNCPSLGKNVAHLYCTELWGFIDWKLLL